MVPSGDVSAISAFLDFTGWEACLVGVDMKALIALSELPGKNGSYLKLVKTIKLYVRNLVDVVIKACNHPTRRALLQTDKCVLYFFFLFVLWF